MKALIAIGIAAGVLWIVDEQFAGGRHTDVVAKAARSVVGR